MHKTRSARGFTLLEVMIAATILGGVVLLVARTVTRTQVAGRSGELDQHAHTLANNALEGVRALVASGATCEQLGALHPTDTSYRGTTFTTITTLDFVRHLDTTSSVLAANSVACADSRAVRVSASVEWPDPLEVSRARSYDLATSVRTVDLRAPETPTGPSAVTVEPNKVAHKDFVTLRWSEGDTLPIPHYVLEHPESRVTPTDPAPIAEPSVAWDGPAPWLGNPNERAVEVPTSYGDPLELSVTRDRDNALTFRAQRDGEHQLIVRNVVGGTTHALPINVIMKPRVTIVAVPDTIRYGNQARLEVANPAPWGGYDDQARLVIEGVNNPHSTRDSPLVGLQVPDEFLLAPPTAFPAVYDARATNLWTATYHGASTGPAGTDLDPSPYSNRPAIECFGPVVRTFTAPTSAEEGDTITLTITVDSQNVPDGTLTLYRDGTPIDTRALAYPNAGDQTITVSDPVNSAGSVRYETAVASVMCRDEGDAAREERNVEVVEPPPPSSGGSGGDCGSLSVSGVDVERTWSSSASAYVYTLRYDVTYSWDGPDRPPDRLVDGVYVYAEHASTTYRPAPAGTRPRSQFLGTTLTHGEEFTEGPYTMSELYVYAKGSPSSEWVTCDTNTVTFGY